MKCTFAPMEDVIKIPASHSKYLVQAYKDAYAEYLEKKKALDKEWDEMEPILKELKIIPDGYQFAENDKDVIKKSKATIDRQELKIAILFSRLSWFERAQFILQEANKPLTVNQIADEMQAQFGFSKFNAVKSISPVLSQAHGKGLIERGEQKQNGEITYSAKYDDKKLMDIESGLAHKDDEPEDFNVYDLL
jgi:hypothetical protein